MLSGCNQAAPAVPAGCSQAATAVPTGCQHGRCSLTAARQQLQSHATTLSHSPLLQVQDDTGRGVPVGFMICGSDTAEVIERFLRELQRGVSGQAAIAIKYRGRHSGRQACTFVCSENYMYCRVLLQAREASGSDFTYGFIMIDKAKAEMAAVRLLELTLDALGWLLCYFHYLQDWERFIRSAESGVSGKQEQHFLMLALAFLAHIQDEVLFQEKVGRLQCRLHCSCSLCC